MGYFIFTISNFQEVKTLCLSISFALGRTKYAPVLYVTHQAAWVPSEKGPSSTKQYRKCQICQILAFQTS